MDKPKRIKFKVKPKMQEEKPKPKKPIKFKVVKKEEKKVEPPKPKKKKINFKVVKKEVPKEEKKKKDPNRKRSELKRVTGVSRKKVKKGDTAEMAGKLPPNIQKNILKQLENITKFDIDDVKFDLILDHMGGEAYQQAQENYFSSMDYNQNYRSILNANEERIYKAFRRKGIDNLTEKQQEKLNTIELKLLEGVSNEIYKEFESEWDDFKNKNKGKRATIDEMAKRFDRYLDNTYF